MEQDEVFGRRELIEAERFAALLDTLESGGQPDVESLVEEVSAARGFEPLQIVVQVYGTCEDCRAGRQEKKDPGHKDLLFARDALRIAIATERSGLEFYTRAARITRDARGRKVFQDLALEEKEHLAKLETRYRELQARDPELETYPTFLFFKGAANGLFAEGADRLRDGVNDQQALLIGIRCERGSHRFFKRYGERFEDSEGKRIFLEFAEEEREHLDLLLREYRHLVTRRSVRPGRKAARRRGSLRPKEEARQRHAIEALELQQLGLGQRADQAPGGLARDRCGHRDDRQSTAWWWNLVAIGSNCDQSAAIIDEHQSLNGESW